MATGVASGRGKGWGLKRYAQERHNTVLEQQRQELLSGKAKCYTCQQVKPLDEFTVNNARVLGRSYECRDCKHAHEKRRRDEKRQREEKARPGMGLLGSGLTLRPGEPIIAPAMVAQHLPVIRPELPPSINSILQHERRVTLREWLEPGGTPNRLFWSGEGVVIERTGLGLYRVWQLAARAPVRNGGIAVEVKQVDADVVKTILHYIAPSALEREGVVYVL